MSQALQGIRVVEFAFAMAGPWIGRFMAHCGAEVIRVESQKRPEVVRLYISPKAPELGIQSQMSPWFTEWNGGKLFVSLDLSKPEAIHLAKLIVSKCDVVVENYSTGVVDKLGLGYSALRQVKPDIIMFSTSGYGDSGPNKNYVTWGSNIEALSGLSKFSGFANRECTITQYAYSDVLSAIHGLFSVMCALIYKAKTGKGQYINLSQTEATISSMGHVLMEYLINGYEPQRYGNHSLYAAPHNCYRCDGDDRWCTISIFNNKEWQSFCNAIGKLELIEDVRFSTVSARLANVDELDKLIEGWTVTKGPYEVMDILQHSGIAAGVVQNAEDLYRRDLQLAARHFFEVVNHLEKGVEIATGIPLGLTRTPGRTGRSGAKVGQDNYDVFHNLVGLSEDEYKNYIKSGAIENTDNQDQQ